MRMTILIGSTRRGRLTPRAAQFLAGAVKKSSLYECQIVDLADFSIPFLEERLKNLRNPHADIVRFSHVVQNSDVLIVVSPEYNGSCPGVLKNALDHLTGEYANRPIGIVTVSAGPHGGKSCYETLRTLFRRLDAQVIDFHLQINRVGETLNESGEDPGGVFNNALKEFLDSVAANLAISVKN